MQIRQETQTDRWEVEALYDLCFAPGRDALSSYRLRDGVEKVAELCLVARDPDDILGGAIRFWPARVDAIQTLLLGPIAVHPTRQGEGLGGALIHASLQKARMLGWERLLLIGDAPYYQRFGFKRLNGIQMPPPTNPARVLGLGAWEGIEGVVQRDLT